MEGRGVVQDLIPNVGQPEFAQVPVESWIIDADEHCLLDGTGNALCLPAHNGKTVHIDVMS